MNQIPQNLNPQDIPTPLYRSEDHNIFLGVCSGIAERFGATPFSVRLAWILAILFFGTGILVYLICAVCIPKKSQLENAQQKKILGVCFRLSHQLNVDVSLLRVTAVLLALSSLGFVVLAYLLLHLILDDIAMNRSAKFLPKP